ncbi:MAG: phasin family protein [Clostridium sp.]|uniref:phasin family protein n=1 Tax=Clostridium sp. TaxID=1506 RepID=UPI003D6C9BE2
MNNDIKNFFLAGLGSAAYTYDKATNLIDDFVKKGKITLEEGKDLSEELKRTVKEKKDGSPTFKKDHTPLTKEDMALLLKEMNFATKDDIEKLNKRLANLEITLP